MYLGCWLSMRLLKAFSIGQQMILIVGDGIDHSGDGTGIDGRTPREQVCQHEQPRVLPAGIVGVLFEGIEDSECPVPPVIENQFGHIFEAFEEFTAGDLGGHDVEDGRLPAHRLMERLGAGGDCEKVELGKERHCIVLDERLEKQILILEAVRSVHIYSPISESSCFLSPSSRPFASMVCVADATSHRSSHISSRLSPRPAILSANRSQNP